MIARSYADRRSAREQPGVTGWRSGTPIGAGENGLIKALHREHARYHERQSALLARVLRGKCKQPKRSGADDRAGTGQPTGGTTVRAA